MAIYKEYKGFGYPLVVCLILSCLFLLGCANNSDIYHGDRDRTFYSEDRSIPKEQDPDAILKKERREQFASNDLQDDLETLPSESLEPIPLTNEYEPPPAENDIASAPTLEDPEPPVPDETLSEDQEAQEEQEEQEEQEAQIDPVQEMQEKLDEALRLCQQAQTEWEEGNPDLAIETLDRANEMLLGVEANGYPDIFQQKEDIRFLVSKRIVEVYASRQRMVNGKHNEIPLVMNSHVEREIQSFLGNENKFFLASYARSGFYRPMILKELADAGLPEHLSWLPLIESGFQSRALSRARALGLWQFIPSTGYKFGLDRNMWIDERMDPVKSTRAAIEYLIQLHSIFGDWTTALAAYNCGEGTVLKVIRNQHINYLDNFWDLYERLPNETARYVPRFMAALYIIEHPEKYGFVLPELEEAQAYEEIITNKRIKLSELAPKMGVENGLLLDLNPELRYGVTPEKEYPLKVPPQSGGIALAQIEEIPTWTPPTTAPSRSVSHAVYHKVRKGDTLSHLADRYKTSVSKIMQANNFKRSHKLRIGERLKIPVKGSKGAKPCLLADAESDKGLKTKTYKVQKGDCAYDIAKNFGMSLKEFLALNRMSQNSRLYPGQKVVVMSR